MRRKMLLCAALAAIMCACLTCAACFMSGGKKADSPVDFTVGEVTDTSIEITGWVYADGESYRAEFSVDGENWTEEPLFNGLTSNTEYTVYARGRGSGDLLPGDPITKKVTTLRSQNTDLPQADYIQERGKITLTGYTSEMEASFDGGLTYSDAGEHTYTQKGKYEILVRYKQNDRSFAGEPVTLEVEYSDFAGGLGTEQKPYLVTSYGELRLLNTDWNYYKLLNDITFPAEECFPILFAGYLDGGGKKFISPKIKSDDNSDGFITSVFSRAVCVKNLTVENAVCTSSFNTGELSGISKHYASILAKEADELINCHVSGKICVTALDGYETAYIGGLAAYFPSAAKIENCSADVSIEYGCNGGVKTVYAGGIAGFCYDSGKISGSSSKTVFRTAGGEIYRVSAGGIVGSAGRVTVSGCSAETEIYADARNSVLGGIAGVANDYAQQSDAVIKNCFASGEIVALNSNNRVPGDCCRIGGILGGNYEGSSTCNIRSCVSAADISVNGAGLNLSCGGMIGNSYVVRGTRFVKDCLYTGNIAATADPAGNNRLAAVLGFASTAYAADNCFIKVQPSSDVDCAGATAIAEEVYLSADWQRAHLSLDESIWRITDGELPAIK